MGSKRPTTPTRINFGEQHALKTKKAWSSITTHRSHIRAKMTITKLHFQKNLHIPRNEFYIQIKPKPKPKTKPVRISETKFSIQMAYKERKKNALMKLK